MKGIIPLTDSSYLVYSNLETNLLFVKYTNAAIH